VVLSRALRAARAAAGDGAEAARAAALEELATEPAVDLDYLAVTAADLSELPATFPPGTEGRVLVAATVGATRLIDNMPLVIGER
jgi:pantoate--beta-alanine ligase